MKKILGTVVAVVVLGIAALFVVPLFIPVDVYRDQVTKAVRDSTGRELAIAGDVSLSLFPNVALRMGKVSFANAPGMADKQMVTLEGLVLDVQLMPLLDGQLKLDSFVLEHPVIHLEKDKSGRGNWEFDVAGDGSAKPAESGGGAPLSDISLGDVRLVDGLLSYRDQATNQSQEVSGINMKVSLPGLDQPLTAVGDLTWSGEDVSVDVRVAKPRALMTGAPTDIQAEIKATPVTLSFTGHAATATPLEAGGKMAIDVPSIRKLAAWTGSPIDAPGSGFGPARVSGTLALKGPALTVSDAVVAVDAIEAKGKVAVDTGGSRPKINGKLETNLLDLNPYLPPAAAEPAAQAGPQDWSDEPMDLSGLKAADVDLALGVEGIQAQGIKVGRSDVVLALHGGQLKADLTRMALYGGSGKASVAVDAREPAAKAHVSYALDGVKAAELLKDAAAVDWLEGTAQAKADLTTQGRSQRDFVGALNGTSSFKFENGAILGINLAAMVRNATTAFLDPGAGETRKTDFAELSGSVVIANGIARNQDLILAGPLLRVTGAGSADLPAKTVDYRIEPKAVATLKGQGGDTDKTGITVPVRVTGPWHAPAFAPDLTGAVEEVLKDPGAAVDSVSKTVKDVKEGAKGGLGSLVEGITSGGTAAPPAEGGATQPPALPNPLKDVKGLFGN